MKKYISNFYTLNLSIAIFMFVIAYSIGWNQGLWGDELETVKLLHLNDISFGEWVFNINISGFNIMLITFRLWAELGKILGIYTTLYWEKWLLIMPALLGACASYFVGLTARQGKNSIIGLISAFIFATSYYGIYYSLEFRFYPWLMCFMAISFFFYTKQFYSETFSVKYMLLYGISMGICVNAQILNVWAFIFLFIIDFILYIKKQKRFQVLIAYPIGAIIALPYAYYLLNTLGGLSKTVLWDGGDPTIQALVHMILSIISSRLWYMIFILSLIYSIYLFLRKNEYYLLIINATVVGAIIFDWIFTLIVQFIIGSDPNTFMTRYLVYLLPLICISLGICLNELYSNLFKKQNFILLITVVMILCSIRVFRIATTTSDWAPGKGGISIFTDWIIEEHSIYGNDSLYITSAAEKSYRNSIQETYFSNIIHENINMVNTIDEVYSYENKPLYLLIDSTISVPVEIEEYTLIDTIALGRFNRQVYVYKNNK